MKCMCMYTGKLISQEEHLKQSIRNIITTPMGSRVMRRDFGCGAFHFIDQPINNLLVAKMQATIAAALVKFEPRVNFTLVRVSKIEGSHLTLDLEGFWIGNSEPFHMKQFKV